MVRLRLAGDLTNGVYFSVFPACLVSYATETVMSACHGKRNCRLTADAATFGNPCKPASRMYLKVVYNCGESCTI